MKYSAPSSAYPGEYRYPLRLSITETENPVMVFTEFFSRHDLPSIRAFLRKCEVDYPVDNKVARGNVARGNTAISEDAVVPFDRVITETNSDKTEKPNGVQGPPPDKTPVSGNVLTEPPDNTKKISPYKLTTDVPENNTGIYEDIEKLIEAAWRAHVIVKKEGEEELTKDEIDEDKTGFQKSPGADILEQIRNKELMEALGEAFFFGLDGLTEELEEWLRAAMSNEVGIYENASERSKLIAFYRSLIPLVEALHIIKDSGKPTGWVSGETENNREIELYERTRHLTDKQVAAPESVVQEFFQKFTMKYIRRELWNWLNVVVSYDQEPYCVPRTELIFFYECLLGLLEIGNTIYQNGMSRQWTQ